MGLGAVGEHGPDLALAVARGFEDDVAAVGRPTGPLVFGAVAGNLADITAGRFHNVNVEIAIGAAPTEGDHLTIRRPRRIDEIALVGEIEFAGVGAVGVHHVELGNAAPIADEYDRLTGLGVPRGRGAGGVEVCDALGTAAVGVDNVEFGITSHRGGKHYLRAVWRPRGGAVGAAETREGDDFVGVDRIHADLRADDARGAGLEAGESDAR